MPDRILQIAIIAGETTCASEPGKFCPFARARADGAYPNCLLFGEPLAAEDGWLQRLPRCLEAESEAQ